MHIKFPNLWIEKGDVIVKHISHVKWLIIIVVCTLVTISMLPMFSFYNNLYYNFAVIFTTTLLQLYFENFTMVWWCYCCCKHYEELYYDKICLHFIPKVVGEGYVGLCKPRGEGCISCHWLKLAYCNCLDLARRYNLSLAIIFSH
jgi:hypothetical protein